MRLLAPIAALLAASSFLVMACSAESTIGASESYNTEGKPLAVVKGREWGRCWFDMVGNAAQLSCTTTKRAAGDPLATTMSVAGFGINPSASVTSATVTVKADLDLESGGTVVVGSFPRANFPVTLLLTATLPRDVIELGFHELTISETRTISRPEDLTAAKAATLKQGFDLWPTGLTDPDGQSGFAINAKYAISVAPHKAFADKQTLDLDPSFFGMDHKGKIRWWAAPANGSIPITFNGPAQGSGELPGPGYYTITREGVRASTQEEIARDFGQSPPAPVDPSGNAADASSPEEPDPVDPDPTPGCGGHKEARCADGSCDPSHRYDSSASTCLSCGKHGQTFCFDSNSQRVCDAKHRYDSSTSTCLSCGAHGQTFCFDSNSQRVCDAAHRYDSSTSTCLSCGKDGQTFCFDSNSQRVCDAGHRYDSSDTKCDACGDPGETYCFINNSRVCNAGAKYDSSSQKCVAQ